MDALGLNEPRIRWGPDPRLPHDCSTLRVAILQHDFFAVDSIYVFSQGCGSDVAFDYQTANTTITPPEASLRLATYVR